jgi:hypothetical protein
MVSDALVTGAGSSSETSVGDYQTTVQPNVAVKWLTLLLHTREVRGSNLYLDSGYSY